MSKFEPIATQTAHTNPNVKPLAQAWGERVSATNLAESAGTNVQRAGLWSTAPYVDPALQRAAREADEKAKEERREISEANLKLENRNFCSKEGCRAPVKRDTGFCRWHQPEDG